MTGRDEYAVRITRRGTASEPFGWEIVRKADASAVARSSRIFPTRTEALADSARAAAPLAFDVDPGPKDWSPSRHGQSAPPDDLRQLIDHAGPELG